MQINEYPPVGVVVSITFCALEDFYHITDGNGLMQRIF